MRLDKYLAEHGFSSRTKAARALAKGLVTVNGKPGKASDEVSDSDDICVREEEIGFVSEGGYKLHRALTFFGDSAKGMTFADIGASTGGFTDCLLQAGAGHVYAVDVGKSQLDPRIASDARVTVMDGVNARYLERENFPLRPDGITADVSFISLALIVPVAARLLDEGGTAYLLIKPQFECGGVGLDQHGVVKDERVRLAAVRKICLCAQSEGFALLGIVNAPLRKGKNVEYILKLCKGGGGKTAEEIEREAAHLL